MKGGFTRVSSSRELTARWLWIDSIKINLCVEFHAIRENTIVAIDIKMERKNAVTKKPIRIGKASR